MRTYRGVVKELLFHNPLVGSDDRRFDAIECSSISRAKQLVASQRGLAFAAGTFYELSRRQME